MKKSEDIIKEQSLENTENIEDDNANKNGANKKPRISAKYWKIGFVALVMSLCLLFIYFLFFKDSGLFGFLGALWNIVLPFLVGAALAYILRPVCALFEKLFAHFFKNKKNRHEAHVLATRLSITVTMILFFAILVVLVMSIIPQVITSLKGVINDLPSMIDNKLTDLENATARFELIQDKVIKLHQTINSLLLGSEGNGIDSFTKTAMEWVTNYLETNFNNLLNIITSSLMGIVTALMNIVIASISCIYILASRKRLASQSTMLLYSVVPKKGADKIMEEIRFTDKTFTGYVNGRIIEGLLIGIICYILMKIFRLPYAELISVWVGVANIVPFFGPFVGAIPTALLLLFTGWTNFFIFVAIIIVLTQIDGNILGPNIMGKATGISGFWVLFSIMLFGGLWGFIGMVIGIPLFAVLYDLVRKLVIYGLQKRGHYDLYLNYQRKQKGYERRAEAKTRLHKYKHHKAVKQLFHRIFKHRQ